MNLHDRDIRRIALQEGKEQGLKEGISQGEQQAKIETATKLISKGLTLEQVAEATGLPKETVIQIQNEITQQQNTQ